MKKELYSFILWHNSGFMEKQIISDIKKKFEIFRSFEINWSEKNFARNLSRFYGKKSAIICHKEKELGLGSFKLFLVYDNNPQYSEGKNINIDKCKHEYCQLTGGGNLIDADNNAFDTNEHLLLLFGKGVKDFEAAKVETELCIYNQDLVGCPCWQSLEEALDTVRKIPFTHVKAYKNSYLVHSKNADCARRILNAESRFSVPGIHKYTINIGKQKQPIYIRQIH